MKFKDIILKNRSYRRFYQDVQITKEELTDFIDHARLSASGRNAQSLKYFISNSVDLNNKIFMTTAWAGYYKEWPGPAEGERPSAYIVILADNSISDNYYCDDGIAAQSIMLAATEAGYGGCMIASLKKNELSQILNLTDNLKIVLVLAIGKPKEKVVIEDIKDNDFKYWRDSEDVHHVPKRSIDEIIINADE